MIPHVLLMTMQKYYLIESLCSFSRHMHCFPAFEQHQEKYHITVTGLFYQFSTFIEELLASADHCLLIVGDCNFHVDSNRSAYAIKFISLIEGFGFTQLVMENTHDKGHCLDLVLVNREDSTFVSNIKANITGPSNHLAVSFSLVPCPPITYHKIEFRRIKAINSEELIHSI